MGLCGGLLLVDTSGRPIEFHCTAPIPPNRAQEILYGSTYEEFLYGESIAKALLEKCSKKPSMLLSNQQSVCAIRNLMDIPAVLVEKNSDEKGDQPDESKQTQMGLFDSHCEGVHRDGLVAIESRAEGNLFVVAGHCDDAKTVTGIIACFVASCDIDEPFNRIGLAINEAMSGVAA